MPTDNAMGKGSKEDLPLWVQRFFELHRWVEGRRGKKMKGEQVP
jgi:hypothetical protein